MKRKYYEAELSYLREEGREFATAFPVAAGMLSGRGNDPDVERLLEGVAFLSSRIRERVDDAVPELAEQYASLVVPHLTRYSPPGGVVEFHPDAGSLREPRTLDRGAELGGHSPSGVLCRFQTTAPLRLMPLRLTGVRTEQPTTEQYRLTLKFATSPQHGNLLVEERLRLFLHGGLSFWSTLRAWFLYHCVQLSVVAGKETLATIPDPDISEVGMREDERLWPCAPLEHDAFTVVAELYSVPEKFAFIDLPPLRTAVPSNFELHFEFRGAPKLPKPAILGDVRVHCVPVTNLFEAESEPIRFDPRWPEHRLRVQGYDLAHAEVWSVEKLTELQSGHGIPPFSAFDRSVDRFFSTQRRHASVATGTDVYLSLTSTRDSPPLREREVLTAGLLCTNRGQATSLALGALKEPLRNTGTSVAFENITPLSAPRYSTDVDTTWRVAAHVGMSRRGLQTAKSLRALLEVYLNRTDDAMGQTAAAWLTSISEVKVRPSVRLFRGGPATGVHVTVTIDESSLSTPGEASLFASVLAEVYARRCPINSFVEFGIELSPSGLRYRWPPLSGQIVL